ncbi:branched-chain amino acid ABC transporter substrate-binding protein [Kibdelosporangium phytohabitans]|uniref:Branched-chain amino acid ABC transporter substrate-binding protein n=1 Tax=Kibdelosporangium phytohabitans TaxID=860235 RepID=A0A0N9I8B4_9PSEU|nr:branched-chain amino acid ABC transporter substrate-binding protein [Kibdelosporangium phytohabitans]ALG12472.1 branched-chain amino acid ABC transporter substrate-binding protein [Kibdelosporangium phytohabitans]
MRKKVATAAVLAAGALLIASCSSNKNEGGTSGNAAGGNQCDTSKGTLTIGVIVPLTGELTALGVGIRNSADLAVSQANEKCTVKGYKLVLDPQDDEKNPQKASQAATKLSSDPNVVGVIGTLNSSTSQNVQPILSNKKIVQISPANTGPGLTRGEQYGTAPKRQFENYFRVCATDDSQGPFAANYLVGKAGKKKIAVVADGKTYGEGLANEFTTKAKALGATIVTREKVGEKDTDFSGVIGKIKPLAPDAVYYGGEYGAAGPFSKQLKEAGLQIPLMGGDGIVDKTFAQLAGKASEGDLATSVGAPAETLPEAKSFIDAYGKKFPKEGYSAYGSMSFDATNALIESLAKTLANAAWGEDQRANLIKNVQDYKGKGANGDVGFDQYGDSTNKLLTVYQVKDGDFKNIETGKLEDK